jgi:hypothetical protein
MPTVVALTATSAERAAARNASSNPVAGQG